MNQLEFIFDKKKTRVTARVQKIYKKRGSITNSIIILLYFSNVTVGLSHNYVL